jgi:hypothetical protein
MAQYSAPIWATLVAGFFMLLALSLSMYLIFEHLSAYNNPEVSSFYFCSPIIIFLHNSVYQEPWQSIIFTVLGSVLLVQEQKFVLGVILMVPCYAIESVRPLKQFIYVLRYSICVSNILLLEQYISLINPNTSVYCGILRDGYEAFAMYCFGRYITACLGKFCL